MNKNLNFINSFKFFNLIIAIIFLTACSSDGMIRLYDGVEKDSSEVATIVFPEALDLQEIDGEKMDSMLFSSPGTYQLQLLPGKHFIKARYSEYWGSKDEGNMEKSNSFYFAFDAKAGGHYLFEHNGPGDLKNALQTNSIEDIEIWATNQATGSEIHSTSSQSYSGFLTGLVSNESQPQPQPQTETVTQSKTQTVPLSSPSDVDPAVREMVEGQLKYWWNLADTTQRENFRKWLATQ